MDTELSKERAFSVELNSRADLKSVTMMNGSHDSVLVEGTIGKLVRTGFTEGIILEIIGEKGTLRIDLTEDEVTHGQPATNQEKKDSRGETT